MSDEVPEWAEELRREVRRAGRAAVAAHAAAEAVEQRLEGTEPQTSPGDDGLLTALMPALDALARMAAEHARATSAPVTWWDRLRARRSTTGELTALRTAVEMLDSQVVGALEGQGITVDREVGCEVDPDRHRVVQTRPGARPGTVAQVLRAGYRRGATVLRVADVIGTR